MIDKKYKYRIYIAEFSKQNELITKEIYVVDVDVKGFRNYENIADEDPFISGYNITPDNIHYFTLLDIGIIDFDRFDYQTSGHDACKFDPETGEEIGLIEEKPYSIVIAPWKKKKWWQFWKTLYEPSEKTSNMNDWWSKTNQK